LTAKWKKLTEERDRRFPFWQPAENIAKISMQRDYEKLLMKLTFSKLPVQQVKQIINDFYKKDYLAEAMGA